MNDKDETPNAETPPAMGRFERHLTAWVALAIATGVGLGSLAPHLFATLASWELAGVNLVVALLIWLMVFPMMLKVDPRCLAQVGRRPRGLALTLVVNWLIKPFTMAGLALLFFGSVFGDMLSTADAEQYTAGLILLGVAPCTAMVFVWSHLTRGDANYTLVQVSINDLILVFAFAPLVGLLLGVAEVTVPWSTLLASVGIFVLVPLAAAMITRRFLGAEVEAGTEALAKALKPASSGGLLVTVVLSFGLQAETLLARPEHVAVIAVPLLIQSYGIFALAYGLARALRLPFDVAAPAAMIGTSNFFELAVAVAISLFGLDSGAALATVVGVLIEVPVMLSLVAFANRTQHLFPAPSPS